MDKNLQPGEGTPGSDDSEPTGRPDEAAGDAIERMTTKGPIATRNDRQGGRACRNRRDRVLSEPWCRLPPWTP
jgi:hypothetical protein